MNHQWSVCKVKIHVSLQLVCTITCTATGGWNRAPCAAWRSLLRTPVPLHLAPRIYCDPMRPRRKGMPRTYCLSTSLCSRAQKSNCTLGALHCSVWWYRSTETKKGKRKFDKLHVRLRTDCGHDRAHAFLRYYWQIKSDSNLRLKTIPDNSLRRPDVKVCNLWIPRKVKIQRTKSNSSNQKSVTDSDELFRCGTNPLLHKQLAW